MQIYRKVYVKQNIVDSTFHDINQKHVYNINKINTLEELQTYDYTIGYPKNLFLLYEYIFVYDNLNFNIKMIFIFNKKHIIII